MKLSTIYRRAAELQANNKKYEGSACSAIGQVTGSPQPWSRQPAQLYFSNLFRPSGASVFTFWWEAPPKDREPRVLALLLAAEIAKSEGR